MIKSINDITYEVGLLLSFNDEGIIKVKEEIIEYNPEKELIVGYVVILE